MKKKPENPNNHRIVTPSTKGDTQNDKKFTSYDTSKPDTSTPQKVRQGREASSEQERLKKSKGDS